MKTHHKKEGLSKENGGHVAGELGLGFCSEKGNGEGRDCRV